MERNSFVIDSREAMTQWGEYLGRTVQGPICFALIGDLGTGKTYFAQAIAEGLGIKEKITSPTFSILNVYDSGRIPFSHFDLYRLDDPEELEAIGFYEYVAQGVSVVEWADKFPEDLPDKTVFIYLQNMGDTVRNVTLETDAFSAEDVQKMRGNV